MDQFTRRSFLTAAAAGVAAAGTVSFGRDGQRQVLAQNQVRKPDIRLGMVTYNMGKDMDLETLFNLCQKTGLEGLELRTTHAHGVEVTLSAAERREVKARFADSEIELVGLGSAFEYHSTDEAEVWRNIEESKTYAQLAADVGAPGIKVRPNGLHVDKGISPEQTCAQIGRAMREVAAFAEPLGVEVRMEVHGRGTSEPRWMRRIMDEADHPNAVVCWNSNAADMDESGGINAAWRLLGSQVTIVHINEIGLPRYPWQALFDHLGNSGYQGYCLAEIQHNPEPERFMRYYRTLFDFFTSRWKEA